MIVNVTLRLKRYLALTKLQKEVRVLETEVPGAKVGDTVTVICEDGERTCTALVTATGTTANGCGETLTLKVKQDS